MDGTVVTLGPKSKVSVQESNNDLSLRLVNGFMTFTLGPASSLSVYSGNTPVAALPGVTTTATTTQIPASATNVKGGPPPGGPPSLSQH